jgi:hypothetical protein
MTNSSLGAIVASTRIISGVVGGIIEGATMRILCFLLLGMLALPVVARAEPLKIEEVASIAALPAGQPGAQSIAFTDHHTDRLADPVSGLWRFSDWAQAKPGQKELLGLYPTYDEPMITVGSKSRKKRMHVYVAEARFEVGRPAVPLDLARYAKLSFLERIDGAIKHRLIGPDDMIPAKNPQFSNNVNPQRRWCEATTNAICIQSHYKLEGKLPVGVALVNKLKEGGRKIADFIEFQSELRVVPDSEIDQAKLAKLTGMATPVAGVLEQNIFYVNQVMQFGKFTAVFQPHPANPGRTVVSAFMALGVDSELLEKKKEYGKLPVLRNLMPAQVLAGNSSFNTGNSISAGLPKYARNRIQAVAALLATE